MDSLQELPKNWTVRADWPSGQTIQIEVQHEEVPWIEGPFAESYAQAAALCDQGQLEEGLQVYQQLLNEVGTTGLPSQMVRWGLAVALDQLDRREQAWEVLQSIFQPGQQLHTPLPVFINWLKSSVIVAAGLGLNTTVGQLLTLLLHVAARYPQLQLATLFSELLSGSFEALCNQGQSMEWALEWLESCRSQWEPPDAMLLPIHSMRVEGLAYLLRFGEAERVALEVLDWARQQGLDLVVEEWSEELEHLRVQKQDPYNLAQVDDRTALERVTKINKLGPSGRNALMGAARTGNLELALWLLQRKADPNLLSEDGWCPVLLAADEGHEPMIRLLVKVGASLDNTNDLDQTGLHLAAWQNHLGVARALLELGVDARHCDCDGNTALHLAATEPVPEMIRLLSGVLGVDVPNENSQGTPLMSAACHGLVENLKLLLELGANPEARDLDGDRALEYALQNGHQEAAEFLSNLA